MCCASGTAAYSHFIVSGVMQGKYRVKFQVDGDWRLAPEWPQVTEADESENNLITVT